MPKWLRERTLQHLYFIFDLTGFDLLLLLLLLYLMWSSSSPVQCQYSNSKQCQNSVFTLVYLFWFVNIQQLCVIKPYIILFYLQFKNIFTEFLGQPSPYCKVTSGSNMNWYLSLGNKKYENKTEVVISVQLTANISRRDFQIFNYFNFWVGFSVSMKKHFE